ncbi:MAG: N-acetylmuramoyl-L-alanine amidase [Verrucomicrobia bacterium]|nr:N-acetylmuramoyl-L-alanine amidase [Verrucomicrobiota bacterium]
MKSTLALLLLWLASLAGQAVFAAPAARGPLERFSIGGQEYVRLSEWARQHHFLLSWTSKTELRLVNNSATISLTVNSQKITVNGVAVWLSVPVAAHNGSACVAPADLTATLQPLVRPARAKAGARIKTICLDPGHGGKDTGKLDGKRREKDLTLALALELGAQLRKAGYKVFVTRSMDASVELEDRPEIARRRGADLFLSLHFNSAGSEVRGVETYCLTPAHTASTNARGEGANTGALTGNLQNEKNVLLAYQLQKSIVSRLRLEDRGVRRARFAVLCTAHAPAALIEGGFMSNPAEAKNIYSAAWRRQLAQAIVEGVKSYQKLVDPPAPKER